MIEGEGKSFDLHRCESNDEWLDLRKKGVGGSDVAAIAGISKYKGAYALWMEKTGQMEAEDISDKPSVHWGNVLEEVVGEEYKKNHPDRVVRRVNAVCRSIERPWAQASLDYEVKDPGRGWGVLEIKTAGFRVADDWAEGVPLYYQTQVQHYLSVTGRKFADVAVLIGGSDYREYRIERDEEDIASIDRLVDEFWNVNVKGMVAPPISGLSSDSKAVLELNKDPNDGFTYRPDLKNLVEERESIKKAVDGLEERRKQVENTLKAEIGDAKGIETDEKRVTWLRSESSRLDTKALKEMNPEIYENFSKKCLRDGGLRVGKAKKS